MDGNGSGSKDLQRMIEKVANDPEKLAAMLEQLKAQDVASRKLAENLEGKHKFWETQPVSQFKDMNETLKLQQDEQGPIEKAPENGNEKLRKEPLGLPSPFAWCEIDIDDEQDLNALHDLLGNNYVEDDDSMFRFGYTKPFLKWALKSPGWKKAYHLGVRSTAASQASSKKLFAFICAIPAKANYEKEKPQKTVEINFLCVHKKLRSKRLAPVLIREITRRCNQSGIYQAVYTAGIFIPTPFSSCRYYHRSLNARKLVDIKFSHLGSGETMQRHLLKNHLPEELHFKTFRPMKKADVAQVTVKLQNFLKQFHFYQYFDEHEVRHWFLPQEDIVQSFVVEDEATKEIQEFISFYSLPSTIIGHPVHDCLRAAYGYYYFTSKPENIVPLMRDALITAKRLGFDVFNCLHIMGYGDAFDPLKFGKGDGTLQYYVFNWKLPQLQPNQLGVVLF